MQIPPPYKSKLNPRAEEGVYLGQESFSSAYRIYKLSTKKIILSRNVVFAKAKISLMDTGIAGGDTLSTPDANPDNANELRTTRERDEDCFLGFPPLNATKLLEKSTSVSKEISVPPVEDDIVDVLDFGLPIANEDVSAPRISNTDTSHTLSAPARGNDPVEDTPRHSARAIQRPSHLNEYDTGYLPTRDVEMDVIHQVHSTLPLNICEPKGYAQAMNSPHKELWVRAMDREMDAVWRNETWELVSCPEGGNVLESLWVYKLKRDDVGEPCLCKGRIVANGKQQEDGIDYHETFAPVAKMTSFRILLAIAAHEGYDVHQIDVNNAYLKGDIDAKVYMKQPKGYVDPERSNHVCRLKKSLYGIRQADNI